MALPFTVEQFHGVFRVHNVAAWPAQWALGALALAAMVAVMNPRSGSDVAAPAILGLLWAWIAWVCPLANFSRIRAVAVGFAAIAASAAARAVEFARQGVARRRLRFRWNPGPKAAAGLTPIAFARVMDPIGSIGLMCFAEPPTPRGACVAPLLGCSVRSQAASLLGVWPDLGLVAAGATGVVGVALIRPSRTPLRNRTS